MHRFGKEKAIWEKKPNPIPMSPLPQECVSLYNKQLVDNFYSNAQIDSISQAKFSNNFSGNRLTYGCISTQKAVKFNVNLKCIDKKNGHFCGLWHLMSMGIPSPWIFSRKIFKHWGEKSVFLNVYMWGHVVKCSRDAFLLTRWWLLIYISPIKPSVLEQGRCSSWEFGCRGWICYIQFSPLIRAEYVTLVLFNLALIRGLPKCSWLSHAVAGTLDFPAFRQNWDFLPCLSLMLNLLPLLPARGSFSTTKSPFFSVKSCWSRWKSGHQLQQGQDFSLSVYFL